MSENSGMTSLQAYREEARIDILGALILAQAIEDGMLVYLLRMAIEQLNDGGPKPQKPPLEAVLQ